MSTGPSGKLAVRRRRRRASFDVADNDKSSLSNKIQEAPLDSWDKEATSYHDQYAKNNNLNSLRLRPERPELLRRIPERTRLRHDVAALLHRRRAGIPS